MDVDVVGYHDICCLAEGLACGEPHGGPVSRTPVHCSLRTRMIENFV